MLLSRRFLWTVAAIAGLAVAVFSQLGIHSFCYASSKSPVADVNESGTIVISGAAKSDAPWFRPDASIDQTPCQQGVCRDLYPKDGQIEGRRVSLLSPAGINSLGQVVGLCVFKDPAGKYAFMREPDGRIWIFRTPSSSGQGEFTDISDSGNAVGFYEKDSSKTRIGFLMNSQKRWVMDIRYPSNPCPGARSTLHTQPNGINDEGEIVGNYDCAENPDDADPLIRGNGFYRAPDGTFYRVQFENADRTVAGKISNAGMIFGYYVVDDTTWMPFAARKDDVIKPIVP